MKTWSGPPGTSPGVESISFFASRSVLSHTKLDFNIYFCVTRASATQIAWRDWGSQFRVAPQPNLASKQVVIRMVVVNIAAVQARGAIAYG